MKGIFLLLIIIISSTICLLLATEVTTNDEIITSFGKNWSGKIIDCIGNDDVGNCLKNALDLQMEYMKRMHQKLNNCTDEKLTFGNVGDLLDFLSDSLNTKIKKELEFVINRKNLTVDIENGKNFGLIIVKKQNGRSVTSRKMKMGNMMYYMMIPALAMAGILPWILPQLQMFAMFLMMINQAAFSMGMMTFVRNEIFNPQPKENIVYINNGYKDKKSPYKYDVKGVNVRYS